MAGMVGRQAERKCAPKGANRGKQASTWSRKRPPPLSAAGAVSWPATRMGGPVSSRVLCRTCGEIGQQA